MTTHPISVTARRAKPLPAELVFELVQVIRNQFFPEAPDKVFYQSLPMLKRVVCCFAAELNRAGVALPADRYRAIVLEVLQVIKRHGDTDGVQFWPGYLLKCFQTHWIHHGEEYLAEGKAIRNRAEAVLMAATVRVQPIGQDADVVSTLAAAYAALTGPKGGRKKGSNRPPAQRLLDL